MTRACGRFIESAHMSNTQKRAYHASASDEEKAVNAALKREFEQLQACVLPRESIDSTCPKHAAWTKELMSNFEFGGACRGDGGNAGGGGRRDAAGKR